MCTNLKVDVHIFQTRALLELFPDPTLIQFYQVRKDADPIKSGLVHSDSNQSIWYNITCVFFWQILWFKKFVWKSGIHPLLYAKNTSLRSIYVLEPSTA